MPPANPTSPSATALNDHQVRLDWTASVGPNLRLTQVFYSDSNSFGGAAFFMGVPAGTTSLYVGGLEASTAYYFWLRAQDSSDAVAASPTSSFTASTTALPASIEPALPSLEEDLRDYFVNEVAGYEAAGTGGSDFPLYVGPPAASPDEAGFVYIKTGEAANPNNPTYFADAAVLCRSTDQKTAYDAAAGLRNFLHPKVDPVELVLPSGRVVMAVREPDKTGLAMDGTRYQVELGFNVQLQGNDAEITPVPPTPAL